MGLKYTLSRSYIVRAVMYTIINMASAIALVYNIYIDTTLC